MMSCRTCCSLVTDAREGALPWTRRLRYRMHLAVCGRCRAYVASLDEVRAALGRVPRAPPPDALTHALSERLRARKAGESTEHD